jgi:phosphodiesterase/alkaline phosphatase D-like protein
MSTWEPSRRRVLSWAGAWIAAPTLAACGASDAPTDAPPERPEPEPPEPGPDTAMADDSDGGDSDVPAPDDGLVAFDATAVPESPAVFTEAVRAGSARSDSVTLITRARGVDTVRVRVWEETDVPGAVRLVVDQDVVVGDGAFVRLEATGLSPGTRYRYAFFEMGGEIFVGRSDVGTVRTAPADEVSAPLTLALCACNGGATGRRDVFGRIADHPEIDAIAHVGDLAYNDGSISLGEYRASWAAMMETPGFRAGLGAAGIYATWDDHEVDNGWNPETIGRNQLENALAAWRESVPVASTAGSVLWGSFRWGTTAEVLVLDCRGERRPSTRGREDEYISRAQMDWLKERLLNSPCRFRIVMNSVPITGMPRLWDLAAADRWEGYPAQRNELLDWIGSQDLRDVWFLSGDFHVCFAGRVQADRADAAGDLWEIAATSGNSNILGEGLVAPQFPFATSRPRLTLVTFDADAGSVWVRFIDPETDQIVWERTWS